MKQKTSTGRLRDSLNRQRQRFRREGRRICSVFLCASLVAGNCTVTPFSAFAEDESGEYEYEFERASFKMSIREAVAEGALDQELNLIGTYAEEYADLLESDGSLYEVFPEAIDEDRDRDRALNLRIFARIEGSIPVDDTYVFDGSEELIFLLENKTDQIQTAAIGIDGIWTDEIEVLPAASVAVDGESGGPGVVAGTAVAETDAAVIGDAVISGGSAAGIGSVSGSGGSSGGSGSNGSSSGSSVNGSKSESADETISGSESDPTEEYADGLNHEVAADDFDPDKTESDDLDGVGDSQGAEGDHLNGDPADITDGQKTEDDANGSVTDDTDDTTEEGSETSGANADADAGESGEDDDELDTGDTSGEEVESGSGNNSEEAGETSDEDDEISDDGGNTDTGSDEVNDSDSDTAEDGSSNTDGENSSGSDTEDTDGGSAEDTSGNDSTSGQTASISLHRAAYLSASLATDSNVEKRATPSDATASDAEHSIDGELLDAVLLDGHGAVAFVTTAADCKLDVIVLSEQEMTCESEDGDQDYLVTVTGWLPDGGFVTAEPVDVEIEGKTVLLALDISIYDDNGELYEPAEDTISVKITSSEIASEETGANYDVYYVPEEGEPELMTVTESEEGDVTFEAEHFSVYAVTATETVYASGTMANADGEADAITWTIYQDTDGTLTTLVISGSGAIPNYTGGSSTPWYSYIGVNTNIDGVDVVIEDGITGIGNYAFNNNIIKSVDIGSDVTFIGEAAFRYVRVLSSITIPGNVTSIGNYAFQYANSLTSITLEEGLESIGLFAFYNQTSGVSYTVSLPTTVTSVRGSAFVNASEYEFLDGSLTNGTYTIVDGVLYTADLTTLADYPSARVADSYRLLDSTTNIASRALSYITGTKEIVIPGSVQTYGGSSFGGYEFANSSALESVIFEDGANASGNNMFESCSSLTSIILPEDYSGLLLRQCYFNSCTSLSTLTIPSGTTTIYGLNNNTTMLNLDTLVYDAENATNIANGTTYKYVFSSVSAYDLIIGTDVDTLITNFDYIVRWAGSITFQGPNFITVEKGAFASADSSLLQDLSGYIYIDEYGAIYQIDTENNTASLIYVPASYRDEDGNTVALTSYTVPQTITDTEDGNDTVYTVTSIASNAFHDADNLTSLTFADASAITSIGAYAMANATKLASVTDDTSQNTVTTVEEAVALFTGATGNIGYEPFYNTALGGASGSGTFSKDMDGSGSLTITASDNEDAYMIVEIGGSAEWSEDEESNGGYSLQTGESLTVTVTAQAPSAENSYVYRLYLSYTDIDYVLNANDTGYDGDWHTTDDPNTVYLEFTVSTESTTSFSLSTYYPNVTSDGGGLMIWGEVLTAEEAESSEATYEQPEDSADTIEAWWETAPDRYQVTKDNNSQDTVTLYAEDGTIRFADALTYQIVTDLSGNTETYGRDLARSAYYEDILTLPDGVEWDSEVLEQIQNGNVYYKSGVLYVYDTAGNQVDIAKMSLSSGTDASLSGVNIKYVEGTDGEEGTVVLYWTIRNMSKTSTLSATTVSLSIYPAATVVSDISKLDVEDEEGNSANAVINNKVDATFHYTYSEDQYDSGSAQKEVQLEDGKLELSKAASKVSYFGEDVTYTLTVSNSKGMTYTAADTGVYTLKDTLSQYTYISADNMETMFVTAATAGYPLTITISGAVLGISGTATDTDGEENNINLNAGNTSSESETTVTLTITYDENTGFYTVSYEGETTVTETGTKLADILQKLGYGVTNTATYTCTWVLGGGVETTGEDGTVTTSSFQLAPGECLTFEIPATTKDTFQMLLDDDRQNRYDLTSSYTARNNVYIYTTKKSGTVASGNAISTVKREAYISKAVYSEDGTLLSSDPSAADGDILEYRLTFRHEGTGTYDDLPMVDDIYGSQLLLVPYSENSGNDSLSECETYDANGDEIPEYYILDTGTYTDVKVGTSDGELLTAAVITVTKADEEKEAEDGTEYVGYHTQIKWYYDHLDGGDYSFTVSYQTLVRYDEETITYSIGNVVWMNDRTGSRIYDSIWGGGTLIDFEKQLVVEEDNTNETKIDEVDNSTGASGADGYDDDKYSTVSAGEEVTYCLILSGHGSGNFTLSGSDLWDLLPETYNVFSWVKGENVTLTYEIGEGITVSGTGSLADWEIVTKRSGLSGSWIKWPEDMTLTFHSTKQLKIYVTLIFPDTDEEGTWNSYVEEVGGTSLANTMYVRNFTSTVTHDLVEKGSVILQKGVYGEATEPTKSAASYTYTPTDINLNHFNNQDSYFRYVVYYVTLYNAGNTKLYLNDLTDVLPDGYTYAQLVGSTSGLLNGRTYQGVGTKSAVTVTGGVSTDNLLITGLPEGTVYKTAVVTKTGEDSSDNTVTFAVTGTSGDYALNYDENLAQYYLSKGEALVFGYVCQVGAYRETGDTATNTISMEYYDYLGAGVTQIQKTDTDYNITGADVTYNGETYYDDSSNDGSRDADTVNGTTTLSSTVEQVLDVIIPGIRKSFAGYTDSTETLYTDDVTMLYGYSTETLYWSATLTNDGGRSITDYTVTDTMPYPYVFEGDVTMTIYSSSDSVSANETVLFSISSRTANDDFVTLTSGTKTYTLSINGNAVTIPYSNYGGTSNMIVSLATDDEGNEILTIRLEGVYFAIPESGKIVLNYSSKNPGGGTAYATYVNNVKLDPDGPFDKKGEGILEGDYEAVSANASITVAGAYATTSSKRVTELDTAGNMTDNTGASDSSVNSIVLSGTESVFRYELLVNNLTTYAMTKLVLIDNLPEEGDVYAVGDTPRKSEFTVNLATDPDFKVYVTVSTEDEDGNITEEKTEELSSDYYTIEYSSDNKDFTTADYAGESDSKWSPWSSEVAASAVRSIRIIITDTGASQIPAGATITATFNAVAYAEDGTSIDPSAIAWNNFGYHYALNGVTTELTAMPLVVGVQVPSAPELTKKLVGLDGNAYNTAEGETFTFVVYQGEEIKDSGSSYTTQSELVTALDAAGTSYKVVTVTVAASSSESEKFILTGSNGLGTDAEGKQINWWAWEDGKSYTIAEFLDDDNDGYIFREWDSGNTKLSESSSYTFTYHAATTLDLTCVNTCNVWDLILTKVDAANNETTLQGAVFALYSQTEPYVTFASSYGEDQKIVVNGVDWYLCGEGETGGDGTYTWTDLTEDSYYLVEIKAPDGYNLDTSQYKVTQKADLEESEKGTLSVIWNSNTGSITVTNEAGSELPETGGPGTLPFRVAGLLIMSVSAYLIYDAFKRRRNSAF